MSEAAKRFQGIGHYLDSYMPMSRDYLGCYEEAEEVYRAYLEQITKEDERRLIAMVLFGVAEHSRISESTVLLKDYRSCLENLATTICESWQEPYMDLLGAFEEQTNTSTIGLYYGGLKNINNYLNMELISRTLRDIRRYIFAHHISGNVLVNGPIAKEVTLDIIGAVAPFGLFEPEDLVLIEALHRMEEEVFENESNHPSHSAYEYLLLGWYYCEKGDYIKAKQLLEWVGKREGLEPHEEAIYPIVRGLLEAKGQMGESIILHEPLGNDNRYEPRAYERFPKIATVGEPIRIQGITYPIHSGQQVYLLYEDHEGIVRRKPGSLMEGEELYWYWDLEPYNEPREITYRIQLEDTKRVDSSEYSFHIYDQVHIDEIVHKKCEPEYVTLLGKNTRTGREIPLYLHMNHDGAMSFSTEVPSQGESSYDYGVSKMEDGLRIECQGNICVIRQKPFQVSLLRDGKTIYETTETPLILYMYEEHIAKMEWVYKADAQEAFYGFGERYNTLNQRGNIIDMYVYNQYKDQSLKTYLPIPFYMSSVGYGLFLDTEYYAVFDMDHEDKGICRITLEDSQLSMTLYTGDYGKIMNQYMTRVGKPKMIPTWALGPWMSSNNWDSQEEVMKQARMTKELHIPSTVLVIEAWSDEATYYIFNDALYDPVPGDQMLGYEDYTYPSWGRWPDPKGMVEDLHRQQLKCILWQIPISKSVNGLHHRQKDLDEKYMTQMGYCAKKPSGEPYRIPEGWFKDSLIMDYSTEAGKKWWFDKRRYLVDTIGVDGFKTDGGEFVFGRHLTFGDGSDGGRMRNRYINDYAGAYYDFMNEGDREGITFSRAGFTGAGSYPAHWAGDERSTFQAFRRTLRAGLNAGMSGVIFWGWDLGGFSGEIPSAELYIRSTQMACFCPIMQYHAESKAEFNQDRTPWNIAERRNEPRVLEYYRYYANLRMNLIPYIVREAKYSCSTGMPLMKSMALAYMEDPHCRNLQDTYLFGRDLLVAPIMEEGASSRKVYLPKGRWYDFFDKTDYEGGSYIEVSAPLHRIPVFVREGAVIPLRVPHNHQLGEGMSGDLSEGFLAFRIYGELSEPYIYTEGDVLVELYRDQQDVAYSVQGVDDIILL